MLKKNNIKILLTFLILSILSVSILYISNKAIFTGEDLSFHKARISGLAEAFQNGNYIPKINYDYLEGFGYATSLFYSDFFLVLPALLVVFGLTLSQTYIVFSIITTFLTFIISYYVRLSVDRKESNSFIFSLLYTFSTYRLTDVYYRVAVGEYLAMMVLPIAFYGLYNIIYKDANKWHYLTLGMVSLLLSHLISALMFALLIVVYLALNIKKLWFEKTRIISLIKATLTTIPLVVFYLFPIFEQFRYQDLKVTDNQLINISKTGLTYMNFINDLVLNTPIRATLGILLFIFMVYYLIKWKKISNKELKHHLLVSFICLVLTLNLPLWDLFDTTFINTIQFPWRFLTFSTFLITYVISLDEFALLTKKWVLVLIISISLLTSVYYQTALTLFSDWLDVSYTEFNDKYYNHLGFGQEYLPTTTSYAELKVILNDEFPKYNKENGTVKVIEKGYGKIELAYDLKKPTEVVLPFINYKGYEATIKGSETETVVYPKKGLATVKIDGKNEVIIEYKGTSIQKYSLLFSFLSMIIFSIYLYKKKVLK